jgi:hypothetical protein
MKADVRAALDVNVELRAVSFSTWIPATTSIRPPSCWSRKSRRLSRRLNSESWSAARSTAVMVRVRRTRPLMVFAERHLEQMHGQPRAVIAKRVAEIATNARQIAPAEALVDAEVPTGLGRPLAETISDELRLADVRCWLSAVVLAADERLTGVFGDPVRA